MTDVTRQRIEELVKQQKRMLASASHELRSPLTRLRMAFELLHGEPAGIEDPKNRQIYIERITGSATDPFSTPADQPAGYVSFLMGVENTGKNNLIFQPKNSWLMTDKKEVRQPVAIEDLMATYGMMGEDLSPAYARAKDAVMSETKFLDPGESTSGLLIYRAFERKTKRFKVDVVLTSPNGDLVRLSANYALPKKKKKKKD